MTPEEWEIADAIRNLRLNYGETQEQFSKRLGVTLRTLTRYELERPPRREVLEKLMALAWEKKLFKYYDLFQTASQKHTPPKLTVMGENIKLFRTALGLTQQELAQKAGLAVITVARYETGAQPTVGILSKLAEFAREQQLPNFADVFEGRQPASMFHATAIDWLHANRFRAFDPDSQPYYRQKRIALAASMASDSTLTKVEKLLAPQLLQVDKQIAEEVEKTVTRPLRFEEDETSESENETE